jgi:hypothetical protein
MTRRMSCSLTVDQVKARTKTETRRHVDTWKDLKPRDRLTLIEKGMGLPKGARQVVLADVVVVANDVVRLYDITEADVAAEGFPEMSAFEFIEMWLHAHGVHFLSQSEAMRFEVRRIRWEYS